MHDFQMIGVMGVATFLVFWLVAVVVFVFWLWALIDILKNEFTGSNKLVWLLAVVLVPLIGVILYFFIGREQKIRNVEKGDPTAEKRAINEQSKRGVEHEE